ncbi:MAG: AAA family ATPase [Chloroflexi bacterium]|nr:AAA family ATPase [Chloroflexota bacterium]
MGRTQGSLRRSGRGRGEVSGVSSAAISPSGIFDGSVLGAPLLRELGSSVRLETDHFSVNGRPFPRRQYLAGPALEPIDRSPRRHRLASWDSQLADLPSSGDLLARVPREHEIFRYVSPTMATILLRTAELNVATRRGFVLLIGPTGCGKTTMAKTYCYLANQPCRELSFSGDTGLTDFYTSVEVVRTAAGGPSTVTVPGAAVTAMLRGEKLLINEINMVSADILNVFSQAIDTGRLVLSGTHRGNVEVDVHRDFGIIGTANPSYIGTLELGRAIERRFGRGLGYIEMDFLPPDEEADALTHEFNREPLFAQAGLAVDPSLCGRLTTLAAGLRHDPQIGTVIQSRLSTRSLLHWLALGQITGWPLREVAERGLLTTAPAEARTRALALIAAALGDARVGPAERSRVLPSLIGWPEVAAPEQAVALDQVPRRTNRGAIDDEVVVHRIRYQRRFPDGSRALIAEPCYSHDGRWVGLGLRLRLYDPHGQLVRDSRRLAKTEELLRDEYGVNVLWRIGRRPRITELLPFLTASSLRHLQLAEAALALGRPVFLAGPTGCGKSSLARTLAYLRGSPVVELSFTGETAKADLSASRRLVGGVTRWTTQAFLEALDRGDTVIVNEYNLAYPDVHSLINNLFDKGARLTLPDGTVHRVHPEARVIATGYLEGPGVKPLNEGVENRFAALVAMDYPPVEEEVALLARLARHAHPRELEHCVRLVDYCRRLVSGRTDPASLSGMSRAAQEALRQAARRAALSTAELVALASFAADGSFARRLRAGILDGAPEAVQRVLEPVLAQYEV